MELNNILLAILFSGFGLLFGKYFLIIIKKANLKMLADDQFKKPQAFHEDLTYRSGGVTYFSLLILVFLYLYFVKDFLFLEYISFCTFFFILGLVDDLKVNIAPKLRLFIMTVFLIVLVLFNDIHIKRTGLDFLDNLIAIDIFSLIFICLCFLFIVNGSNLVDGFNGLLCIHSLIIFTVLFLVNLFFNDSNLTYLLFCVILLNLIFLKFNFPKAEMFLGDSGAYLIGTLIAVSVINTSNLNLSISPFFFCILLFYLFFEVFFSFFRKILVAKQSPLLPDNFHLHMSLYKLLLKRSNKKINANYTTSIYINIIYLILICPGIIYMEDGLFCRYYFFFLIIIYTFFYKFLYEKAK
tara:strand:- start:2182 stop:3240 length:1059 start_codon:yes stop_codon:yes gene_type:complete